MLLSRDRPSRAQRYVPQEEPVDVSQKEWVPEISEPYSVGDDTPAPPYVKKYLTQVEGHLSPAPSRHLEEYLTQGRVHLSPAPSTLQLYEIASVISADETVDSNEPDFELDLRTGRLTGEVRELEASCRRARNLIRRSMRSLGREN